MLVLIIHAGNFKDIFLHDPTADSLTATAAPVRLMLQLLTETTENTF